MKKGISTISAVCITVIVMIALAAGGWYLMDKQAKEAKKTTDDQIATLQAQVSKLEKAAISNRAASNIAENNSSSTPTDPTAGWKTYTNESYQFSFRYPADYSISDLSTYAAKDGACISEKTGTPGQLFCAEAEPTSQSLSSYLAKATADGVFNDSTKITFAGKTAYEGVDAGMTNSYGILVQEGTNIYHITLYSGGAENLAESKAALTATQNQMLENFRFIN